MTDRLVLIDGSGFIFRAYHKLPPLTRPDGVPSGAVYGFTTMLLKIREQLQASHMAVVFDASSITFRNDLYADYKAHRPPPPEDLVPQFPLVRDAARAMGLAVVEQIGVEADDVIATYALQAKQQHLDVMIVSSDKDLMQLMAQGITMFDPMKNAELTLADVEKKFGVAPDKVIEVQALMGDSTDNIPGVPSIGPKTAAQLIGEYGTVENLLAHAEDIPQKKRREMLIDYAEQARISKQLVTLKTDCTDLPEISEFAAQPINPQVFAEFCSDMNFTSLRSRVEGAEAVKTDSPFEVPFDAPAAPVEKQYQLIQSMDALHTLIDEINAARCVAIDCETTSLDATQAELVGMSFCVTPGTAYYLPLAHKKTGNGDLFDEGATLLDEQINRDAALDVLRPMLANPAILKIGQNIKYDAVVLHRHDVTVTPLDDTMLLSYCLAAGAQKHNMDELAQRHLGITPIAFKEVVGTGKAQITFDYVPLEQARDYAAEDADITLRLWHSLKPAMLEQKLTSVYERMERPLINVIVAMETRGIKVDKQRLREMSNRFATQLAALEADIFALAGREFSIGSPKQLGEILFDELALAKGKKSKSGAYATGAEILEELALSHELPAKVLEWRQLSRLKSTYSDALVKQINPRTGRVHTSYSMAATSTGRLSSSDPNLQNIPIRTEQGRMIREAFIVEEGFTLLAADYSQIELRLLAHVADIAPLKDAFRNKRDIHATTASQMFSVSEAEVDSELRRRAKTINFGIIYGISAHGLAQRLGIGRQEAADYIEKYFTQYPGIRHYMEETKIQAKADGYVTTLWGRRCYVPMITSKNPNQRAFAERAAINAPLQGSAADIIKRAMISVQHMLNAQNARTRMLLQVHDELVFELSHGEEALIDTIRTTMEQVAHLSVPLIVDTGTGSHWGEAH